MRGGHRSSRGRPGPTGRAGALRFPWLLLAGCLALLPLVPAAAQSGGEGADGPPGNSTDDRPGDSAAGEAAPRAAPRESDPPFHASAYLRLGHWAYPALDYWISAGRVDGLSPLTRPYRRIEVARAVRKLADADLPEREERWRARLAEELSAERAVLRGREPRAGFRVHGTAGAAWWSQTHRDPLRPELEGPFADDEVLERVFLHGSGEAGSIVGAIRGGWDRFYHHDAQFPGGDVVPVRNFPVHAPQSLRLEESYVELQGEYGRISVGRMYRNWGPPGMPGFLRSGYAYSEDEIGYRLGSEKVFLAGTFASYSDFAGDTTRYAAVHRLEWRPWDSFVVSASEATIHGGPSENLDLALIAPFSVWEVAREGDRGGAPSNFTGQVDLWWKPADAVTLYGSGLIDATNKVRDLPPDSPFTGRNCCEMGASLGVDVTGLAPGWMLRGQLSALQSLVYRTGRPWEEWTVDGLGLGWDKGDLYLGRLEASWLARPGLTLRARLDVQARGERSDISGNLRPPSDSIPDFPLILVGETERTIRPSLSGRWHRPAGGGWAVDLDWDLGVSFIQDYRNRTGDDRTAFVGRIRLLLETPRAFLGL